jgi:hypothetical protein
MVRWLSVDGHVVDCHLRRTSLSCHNVINVDTNVDCRLGRIAANSSLSYVFVACTVASHCTVNDAYVASTSDVAL